MHEMSIAGSIIEAVQTEVAQRPGAHVTKVGLRLGEMAGLDEASLRFCFEALVRGTDLDPVALDIEFCPRRNRCLLCGITFPVLNYDYDCPSCASPQTLAAGGDELELKYLEMEEP